MSKIVCKSKDENVTIIINNSNNNQDIFNWLADVLSQVVLKNPENTSAFCQFILAYLQKVITDEKNNFPPYGIYLS